MLDGFYVDDISKFKPIDAWLVLVNALLVVAAVLLMLVGGLLVLVNALLMLPVACYCLANVCSCLLTPRWCLLKSSIGKCIPFQMQPISFFGKNLVGDTNVGLEGSRV